MIIPDTWAYTNRLAATHPGEKCLLAALMLGIALFSKSALTAAVIFSFMSTVSIFRAGIPALAYGKILLAPCAFVCGASAAVIIDISPAGIGIAGNGLHAAAIVFCRSMAASACLLFLCLTTPVADLTWVLGRLRVPGLLIELSALTYRCIFILAGAAECIVTAQSSRLGYGSMKSTLRSTGVLAGAVLIRSLESARHMQQAYDSRCGSGRSSMLHPGWVISFHNILAVLLAALLMAVAGLFRIL